MLNGNGSTTETVTDFAGTSLTQAGRTVTIVSADRLTTTTSTYVGTNVLPQTVLTTVTNADGRRPRLSSYGPNSATLAGRTVTASARTD